MHWLSSFVSTCTFKPFSSDLGAEGQVPVACTIWVLRSVRCGFILSRSLVILWGSGIGVSG